MRSLQNIRPFSARGTNWRTQNKKLFPRSESFHILPAVGLHIGLGLTLQLWESLATVHAIIVIFYGLWWAFKGHAKRVLFVSAYIVGSEVLWRMFGVSEVLVYELGKYAIALIFLILLIQIPKPKVNLLPAIFFGLLIPATFLTFLQEPTWYLIRTRLSFNLSGPFVLAVGGVLFSNIEFNREDVRRWLLSLMLPLASVATISLSGVLSIVGTTNAWVAESNFAASGGFGPNQVSAILGVGTLAAWLIVIYGRQKLADDIIVGFSGLWFLVQAVLTFSRGGVFTALLAGLIATLPALGDSKRAVRVVFTGIALLTLITYFLFPTLQEITAGSLSQRYTNFDTTGRDILAQQEIQLFQHFTLWGTGVGQGISSQQVVATHTEFTRLMGEHGILGVLAILLLIEMARGNLFNTDPRSIGRGVVMAGIAWSVLFMFHSATRIAAPSILFSLGFVRFESKVQGEVENIKPGDVPERYVMRQVRNYKRGNSPLERHPDCARFRQQIDS